MSFQLVFAEDTLLREIAEPELTRKSIAMTYRLAMDSDERESIDWAKVNNAIIVRWSISGLKWIKKQAHSGACFK